MRSLTTALLATVAAFLVLPGPLTAQEEMEPEKHEGPWYEIVHVDFKPGKADDAFNLIREHYWPTEEKAGTGPVLELVHATGEWDATWIWKLEEGPGEFAWKTSPDNIAFQKALREHAGGEKKAEKIEEKYQSYVQDSKVIITRSLSEQDQEDEEP